MISKREQIYIKIRDDITNGILSPGERLVESHFTKKLKTSRIPIREAFRQLEGEGLITFEQNKGYKVSKLSIKEIEEIYTLQWLLESFATRLFAENASENDLAYLMKINNKLKEAAKSADIKKWIENNTIFHEFFYKNSGNDNFYKIIEVIKRRIFRYRRLALITSENLDIYIKQHEAILKGIKKKDGEMAEHCMREHIQMVKEAIISQLQKANSIQYFY